MKNIICYGDSNTFGYNPKNGSRYDENTRWTAILQKNLKSDANLVLSAMGNYKYKASKVFLKPENSILIYTDGVTEAQNTKEEFYGEERLINILNSKIQNPKETIESIKADINEFTNGASQFDDITMLELKYLG